MESVGTVVGVSTSKSGDHTKTLLSAGAVAGFMLTFVSFIQAFTRTGFDVRRDPISMLGLGQLGWIQIANFILSGALSIAAAIGLRQAIRSGRGKRWLPRLVTIFGITLITAGIFTADPAFGYPPGAPEGMPSGMTWHSALHGMSFSIGMIAFVAACFVFARRFAERKETSWSVYSVLTGLTIPVCIVVSSVNHEIQGLALACAVILISTWLSAVTSHVKSQIVNDASQS